MSNHIFNPAAISGDLDKDDMSSKWAISYADILTVLLALFMAVIATYKLPEKETAVGTAVISPIKHKSPESVIKRDSLIKKLRSSYLAGYSTISVSPDEIKIELSDSVLFNKGQYSISNEKSELVLKELAEMLETEAFNVRIEGHTDTTPMSGAIISSNWELSVLRATSVLQVLEALGLSKERLSAAGYGDTRPVALNDTPENMAKNRRISIVIFN